MPSRSSPITVGRENELARIDDAFDRAATGRPAIVVVRGEAGIGKTRLIADAINRARAAGSTVLHGACLDLEGDGLPYLPLVQALRAWVRATPPNVVLEAVGPARDDLGQIVPEIAALATSRRPSVNATNDGLDEGSASPGRAVESGADRARLFERLLGFLDRLGRNAPVLAVMEDVQWIDPATHDLITFLVHNVTTEPVVAILTCRTDDLAPGHPTLAWLAELGRAPGAVRIDLGRLSREGVERQLDALSGEPVPSDLVESIWRRSEGHPLFAEELFAAVGTAEVETAPPSLIEILLARVARLDERSLAVVRALAVAGGRVDERLIGRLVDRTPSETGAALRAAAALGVVAAEPTGGYAFRHELLREVVERDLSPSERRDLHAAFARELSAHPELGADRPAEATAQLARHWFGADEPNEAHRASLAAAAAAEAIHAFGDAHRQLERAIALETRLPTDSRPSPADAIDVRRRAATVADLAGQPDRAAELIRDALAIAEPSGVEPRTVGLLHARLAFLIWARGDAPAALAEHRLAVDLVPAEPATMERAAVLGGLGGALMGLGRWAESRALCEAAIDTAARCGSTPEESRARTMLGSDLVALGELEAGLDELRAAHRLAREPSELWVVTGHNLALNLLATGRFEEALDIATRTLAGTRAGGLERRYGMELAALLGDILTRVGRWDEADAVTAAGLALDRADRGTPYLAVVRSRLLARRGAIDAARRRVAAVERAQLEPDLALVHAIVSAEVELLDGRSEQALAAVEAVLDDYIATGDTFWGMPLLGLGARAAAEIAEARRAARDDRPSNDADATVARIRAHAAALDDRVLTPGAAAWIATTAAELSRLGPIADPAPWAAAVTAWDRAAEPAEAAYARFRLAEASLRRSGVKADVATELTEAARTARTLGATWLEREIGVLARRARIALDADVAPPDASEPTAEPTPEPTPARGVAGGAGRSAPAARDRSPGHGLSAREIEVLRLVAAGRSNGEIGETLFITRKTAGVHVTHILDKLGVTNRVEAAMAGARLGLLEPDSLEAPGSRVS